MLVSIYRLRILIQPKQEQPPDSTGTSFSGGSYLLACLSSHDRLPELAHFECDALLSFLTLCTAAVLRFDS